YDTGGTVVSVCYFDHERRGVTCGTTGRVLDSASLYEYCRRRYPDLGVAPEDGVVYVSFPGMRNAAAVAANLRRVPVMPDGSPALRGLDGYKTFPPRRRKADVEEALPLCRRAAAGRLGFTVEDGLWRPSPSEHGLLPCPELVF